MLPEGFIAPLTGTWLQGLRAARRAGCKISVNTAAHSLNDMEKMHFGISQLRRAWLTAADVLNTLPVAQFLPSLRRRAQT